MEIDRKGDRLLPPGQVARLFGVDPRTVSDWARAGKIGFTRTVGGQRRYWESDVRMLLAQLQAA